MRPITALEEGYFEHLYVDKSDIRLVYENV